MAETDLQSSKEACNSIEYKTLFIVILATFKKSPLGLFAQ